jgi:hypothetical protein
MTLRIALWLCALCALAACGAEKKSPAPATNAAPNSTRAHAWQDTPVVSSDGGDSLPTLAAVTEDTRAERVDCGDLTVAGKPRRAADAASAQAAAACFMSVFSICQPAVLTIRERDTGIIRQFSVEGERAHCVIRQALQPDANSAPAVVECASANVAAQQLAIRDCSHLGDFILPLGN